MSKYDNMHGGVSWSGAKQAMRDSAGNSAVEKAAANHRAHLGVCDRVDQEKILRNAMDQGLTAPDAMTEMRKIRRRIRRR